VYSYSSEQALGDANRFSAVLTSWKAVSYQASWKERQGWCNLLYKELISRKWFGSKLEIDRYIGPILGFHRYISIGQNASFISLSRCWQKRCYIPHASRQLAQESTMNQVETVIFTATLARAFSL